MMEIWNRTRKPREKLEGSARIWSLFWVRKTLPDAGAEQYAFESYGTPTYDFALGNGATFARQTSVLGSQPAAWSNYTAPILSNPPSNIYQGQFATQPLMDPNTATALGLTVDGAIPADSYNLIPPAGPVLAP
jgi:hypothetical protein